MGEDKFSVWNGDRFHGGGLSCLLCVNDNLTYASWKEMEAKTKASWPVWGKLAGYKIGNLNQLRKLGNSVYIYRLYNVPFPPEFSKNEIDELIDFHSLAMPYLYRPKEIGQLLGSEQLKLVTHYIVEASQQKAPLKYVLLSAHDSTLLSLMSAMGTPLEKAPPYAAHLSFSLYENEKKQHSIVVRYNDQIIYVPGCQQNSCTPHEFSTLSV